LSLASRIQEEHQTFQIKECPVERELNTSILRRVLFR